MVSITRLLVVALLVVALAAVAALIDREWYTIILLKRTMSLKSIMEGGVAKMEALVKALPPSESPKYVILSIRPKMGTSWTGHITHQLLTHGKDVDPSINLMEDSPYPEFGEQLFGKPLHELEDPVYWKREPFASYPAGPVTIRTHVPLAKLKEMNATEKHNFRLVGVLRDPADTIMSMWRFMPTASGIDYKLIPFTSLFRIMNFIGMLDEMFIDYADFWERRHDPNVLILFFDDMKEDLRGSTRRLADLLALKPPLTDVEFDRVVNQSSMKFMSSPEVEARFNEQPRRLQENMWKAMGITEKDVLVDFSAVGVVRKGGGKTGEGKKALPQEVQALILEKWAKYVLPRTNCKDLEEMREKMKEERVAGTVH